MGYDDVDSGYSISTSFRKLMGCQRDPQDRSVAIIKLNQNDKHHIKLKLKI